MSEKVDGAANLRLLMEVIAAHQERLNASGKEPSAGEVELDAILSAQLDKLKAAKTATVCRSLRVASWIGRIEATAERYIALYVATD